MARILSARLDGLLISLEQAASNVHRLARDAEIGSVAKRLREAGDSATTAFDAAEGAFDKVSSAVDERSSLHQETLKALRSVSVAARSVRDLADYLGRHPEALIRGKR